MHVRGHERVVVAQVALDHVQLRRVTRRAQPAQVGEQRGDRRGPAGADRQRLKFGLVQRADARADGNAAPDLPEVPPERTLPADRVARALEAGGEQRLERVDDAHVGGRFAAERDVHGGGGGATAPSPGRVPVGQPTQEGPRGRGPSDLTGSEKRARMTP